jgi:hypothetical protein
MADDWNEALKRFDERTAKRRARAKEQEEKAREVIREAQERQGNDEPAE